MPLFRRKAPDPEAQAIRAEFTAVAVEVDAAQRALLAAIPRPRDEGVPLAEALLSFDQAIARARAALEPLDDAQVWAACGAALDEAATLAGHLRLEPAELTFEALNARVGDVLHPLEIFADVERALRRGEMPRIG
jgi:hypothetical protein